MFFSKLKWITVVVTGGSFLTAGTMLLGHRVMGFQQTAPAEAKPQAKDHAADQGPPSTTPSRPAPESLESIAKARLDLAQKLRDGMFTLFQEGETDLLTYLTAQKRYDDVVGEVTVKSNADRVRFHERQLAGRKRIEQIVKGLHAKGRVSEFNLLTVELDRLEAEEALAKVKAKFTAADDAAKARLENAKRLRDAMFKRLQKGNVSVETYLTWQRRYDHLVDEVVKSDADRVRLHEQQVAFMKQLEQAVNELSRNGEAQESDVLIVEYYRLEVEEALANARLESKGAAAR